MHFDLIIAGGVCANHGLDGQTPAFEFTKCSVAIQNGKILELGLDLEKKHTADQVFDAKGLHVLPGAIDTQVHFREPGNTHKEDLASGTLAAIAGGVTSVLEMPNTKPATTTAELFKQKCELTKGRISANVGFFLGATASNASEIAELENLPGCCGIKIFMGSSTGDLLIPDDATLLKVLSSGKRRVAVHAEDEELLNQKKQEFASCTDVRMHDKIRNEQVALKATQRIVGLARKAGRAVHILHVSSQEEMEFLKSQKAFVSVETTPQFLLMHAPDCYERLGTLAQMNPPIREKRHQEAVWRGLKDRTVDVIGTDHAPHTIEEKRLPYPQAPSGMPGVQTVVPLLLNWVNEGKISLEHVVDLLCENPARLYKMKGKGRIAPHFDADFTIVDLNKSHTITNAWIKSKCGWTPYDGMTVQGWPRATIVGGHIVMRDDAILGKPQGRLLEFE